VPGPPMREPPRAKVPERGGGPVSVRSASSTLLPFRSGRAYPGDDILKRAIASSPRYCAYWHFASAA
jgi:hypothetical protein